MNISKETADRMYTLMREKGITSSDICRELNIEYPCFKAMLNGKQNCFGKWQKKIAELLQTDRHQLFKED